MTEETSISTTLKTGFSGSMRMVNLGQTSGYIDFEVTSASALSANAQTNLTEDLTTGKVFGSFNVKITNSTYQVIGSANGFIVTGGGKRYVQVIPNIAVPANSKLIGAGTYCYKN